MLILGIESSCDETAAAVLRDGEQLLAEVISSQVKLHSKYGGVVPELASRKHLEDIWPVVQKALDQADVTIDQLDGIAVTQGPGLVGSLLIGFCFAKALSFVKKIPYVGVDHLTGHLLSVFLADDKPDFPYVALVVSGGHSSLFLVNDSQTFTLLGRTRDDAAGEAFDKVAKLLDLGYPGGPIITETARAGNAAAIRFPRARLAPDSLDFSFSGLKTAVANHVNQQTPEAINESLPDICASFQEAVVEVLVEKTLAAAKKCKVKTIVMAGGVAANQRLRDWMRNRGHKKGLKVCMPPPQFCTDNAAMIALAGYHKFNQHSTLSYDQDVYSRSQFIINGFQ